MTGVLVVCVGGCSGGGNTTAEVDNESDITVTEGSTESEKTTEKSELKGIWVDIGFDGEVNVNACPELAKDWWESSSQAL